MVINWGSISIASGDGSSALTSFAVPFTSSARSMTVTNGNNTSYRYGLSTFTNTQYKIVRSSTGATVTVYYIAIGV